LQRIKGLVLLFLIIVAIYVFAPYGLKLWFPYYYQNNIEYYAKQSQLDSLFVASVIRVESKFNPMAESNRGARGLMQLMPETAQWVAGQLDILYEKDRLFEPDYNIRLGCWYLANLFQEFDDNSAMVLAAYNGGRGNVNKWLESGIWSGKLKDIDSIPYQETRYFIKRVNITTKMYYNLYGK
jgi:soluble lytic murein transglycosylase